MPFVDYVNYIIIIISHSIVQLTYHDLLSNSYSLQYDQYYRTCQSLECVYY